MLATNNYSKTMMNMTGHISPGSRNAITRQAKTASWNLFDRALAAIVIGGGALAPVILSDEVEWWRVTFFVLSALCCVAGAAQLSERRPLTLLENVMLCVIFFAYIVPLPWSATAVSDAKLIPLGVREGGISWPGVLANLGGVGLFFAALLGMRFASHTQPTRICLSKTGLRIAVSVAMLVMIAGAYAWTQLRGYRDVVESFHQAGAHRFFMSAGLEAGMGRYGILVKFACISAVVVGFWLGTTKSLLRFFALAACAFFCAGISSVNFGRMAIIAGGLSPIIGYSIARPINIKFSTTIFCAACCLPVLLAYTYFYRPLSTFDKLELVERVICFDLGRSHIIEALASHEALGGIGNVWADLIGGFESLPGLNWLQYFIRDWPSHYVYSEFALGVQSFHFVPGLLGGTMVGFGQWGLIVGCVVAFLLTALFSRIGRSDRFELKIGGSIGVLYLVQFALMHSLYGSAFFLGFAAPAGFLVFVYAMGSYFGADAKLSFTGMKAIDKP